MKEVILRIDAAGNLLDDYGSCIYAGVESAFATKKTPEEKVEITTDKDSAAVQLVSLGTSVDDILKLKASNLI